MNILVVGCGHVGSALVRDFERAGHEISLVEKDPKNLRRLDRFVQYTFAGTALVGDGTDLAILRKAGIENCDAVAIVSPDDASNLMTAQIAKKIFHKENVLCRVSDGDLAKVYEKEYGIDTICPTFLTVGAFFEALHENEMEKEG